MRLLLTFFISILVVSISFAQQALTHVSVAEAAQARHAGELARSSQRGGGNILFSENFSNGFDGINGNGAWTTSDNANGDLWIWVAPGAPGLPGNTGFYSNGNATGVSHPGGEFSTNVGPLESGTPENGWMIFDCDYFNTPVETGYQDTDGSLTSPMIDFSNYGSVILNWDQYFRYCCFPYAPIYVDVTNDGGVTWTTFDGHGSFIEAANTQSANPLPSTLDISCVAAYSDSVQIRFTYTQAPETGNSYSHYYWGIDDVVVSSNDNADDLAMVQLTNGDIYNVWEYRVTPMEQAISAADGGVLAGILYRNNGTENQEDVAVLVEVLNEAGDEVLASVTETLETVYSFANGLNCPANSQDTIYIATGWEPSTTGNYILRSTITSGSSTDASPEDNTMSKVIVYTDDEFGHDDEAALDGEMFPRESDLPGLYDPTGQGNFYHMVNSGSTAYGITVEFGANCGLSIGGDVAELEFESRLYFYDGAVGITDSPFESTFWTYDTDWSNAGPIYLPFEDPIELDADAVYFAAVISEYESEGGLTVNAQLNSDTDTSTGAYFVDDAGNYVWFRSQTYTPAVRLVLSERSFSGCTDPTACNYNSNADTDDGSCVFPELGYDCDGQVVCFDIFISEYVEGSGNNRAVEFFNPTSESIDLSAYELQRWSNGEFTVTDATQLFGTLPPLSTWVLVNGQTEDVDLGGGGISPACDPELQALADQLDNPYPAPTFMNGNDALVLVKNGTTVIDIFGKPGEDPGVAWTDDAGNGFTDVGNGADWLTSNHTLRRKFDVVQGITDPPVVFDTFLEWDTLGLDTWDGLGFHNCFCGDSQSEIEGCTDINACNYNSTALINDGSCVFPEQWYDCLGECISDVDNDAICDQLEIIGCTNYEAYNFNSEATDSDNTLCIYFVADCNSFGDSGWLDTESGTYPGQTSGIFGEIYNEDIAVHLSNTIVEPGSGVSYALDYFDFTSMSGLPQGLISTMTVGPMNPNSEVCVNVSGIPIETGVFDILFTGEAYINVFGISTYAGVLSFTHTLEIGDNPNPISGCTYPGSDNYLVYAMVDDGSCIISGCTDTEASNFHAIFNFEDGSCQYVEDISDCIEDLNQDGTIGTPDLLQLLSTFGQVCE